MFVKSNGKCACWLASRKTIWWPRSLVCYSEDGKRQVALHRSTIPRVTVWTTERNTQWTSYLSECSDVLLNFLFLCLLLIKSSSQVSVKRRYFTNKFFSVGWPVWHSFFCARENVEIFLHYIIVVPPTGFDFRQYISCVTPPSPGSTAGNQSIFS